MKGHTKIPLCAGRMNVIFDTIEITAALLFLTTCLRTSQLWQHLNDIELPKIKASE